MLYQTPTVTGKIDVASVLSVNPVVKNRRVYHRGHREHRERIWQLSPIPVYGSARFTRSGVQLVLVGYARFPFAWTLQQS